MAVLQTLRAHLFALVFATLAPAVVLLGYMIHADTQHAIAEAKTSMHTLSRLVAGNTSRLIGSTRESMEHFAERPLVKALDGKRCDPVIYDFRDLFPHFANLTTITLDGTAVCSAVAQPGGKPVNVGKAEWFKRALTEQRFLAGDPFIGPITGRWVSVLISPIRDDRNEISGFVGLPLDLQLYAPGRIDDSSLAPGTRMGIVTGNGHLVWRNQDPEGLVGKDISHNAVVKMVLATGDGTFEGVGTDGVHRLYAVATIPEVGWYAFVGTPSAAQYAKAVAGTRMTALFGSLALLASLALAVFLTRRIAHPISNISGAARAIKEGNRTIRAPLRGPREVIQVAGDFNKMVDAWVESEAELAFLANHDVLTGLPNRMLLADRMKQAINRSAREQTLMAVCFVDLDSFKPVNDQHGHEIGDRLLMDVGGRMEGVLRAGDTVARLGGDEFVLLVNDLDSPLEVEQTLLRLQAAVHAPYVFDGSEASVSASIGVAIYPLDDSDPDTLLRHADHAMYVAKQSGKGLISFFDPNQERRLREWHVLRDEIRLALRRDEFVLHYQPKVNMRSGAIVGAEALVRWHHPARGLLMPGAFLPAIEDTELIVALGDWVLREAFRQIDAWNRMGLSLRVSVNVAAMQLQDADFMRKLAALLAEYPAVAPAQVEMEILESAALADIKSAGKVMGACRDIGIDFALDDFGTGYSSLTYLKQLPAAVLKIDQSFIRDMIEEPDSLAITEGILGLARAFGRMSIAEGVETIEHGIVLLHMGCDFGQGYGIARPMPAADFAVWAADYRPDARWLEAGAVAWRREDFPLLTMEAEHRRWVKGLIAGVESGDAARLPLQPESATACDFGRWYHGEGQTRYSTLPEFRAVDTLHAEVHAIAGEIAKRLQSGQRDEAQQRVAALCGARDAVLAALQRLRQAVLNAHLS